jgi:hypothetical protein
MVAAVRDIIVEQGATFSLQITSWKDENGTVIDLTGYTARLQMRTAYSSVDAFLTLTTENGGIVLGGGSGSISISASAAATAAIKQSKGVYDLEMIAPSGFITRLIQGDVTISKEVTRWPTP